MNAAEKNIEIYHDDSGKEPFSDWIKSLTLRDRVRILARLDRVETGNIGDYKSMGEYVYELRFYFGPGYRVYYGETDDTPVVLLCGGNKSSQRKDVKKAKEYWKDYMSRREQ